MLFSDRPMSGSMKNALMEKGGLTPSFGQQIQAGGTIKPQMVAGVQDLFAPSPKRAGFTEDAPVSQMPAQSEVKAPTGNTRWRVEGGNTGVKMIMYFPSEDKFQILSSDGKTMSDAQGYTMNGKGYVILPSGHELEVEL